MNDPVNDPAKDMKNDPESAANAPVASADGWYSEAHATFGDRLAAAREATGLSQKHLARRLGVKPKTIAAWENDVAEPRANRLQMLAGLLNVSLMWLLNGEGEGVAPPDEDVLGQGARAILRDLRDARAEIDDASTRLARLEKHLKRLLETAAP